MVRERFASFILFSFLFFHKSDGVSKIVDIGELKDVQPLFCSPFGFDIWFSFFYRKFTSTFLKCKHWYTLSVSL